MVDGEWRMNPAEGCGFVLSGNPMLHGFILGMNIETGIILWDTVVYRCSSSGRGMRHRASARTSAKRDGVPNARQGSGHTEAEAGSGFVRVEYHTHNDEKGTSHTCTTNRQPSATYML